MKNLRPVLIVLGIVLILSIPFFAMRFGTGVNWSPFDFIVAGVVLVVVGVSFEVVMRFVTKTKHRVVLALIILAALVLVWIELAVGLFGTPFAGT